LSTDIALIVAIDGPAGSGKSTLARRLATELGIPYVNTGLMYRALAARALHGNVNLEEGSKLAEVARELRFDLDARTDPPSLSIDGEAPASELVSPEVEAAVSAVARHPEVRREMVEAQRRLGADGAVMEGRDIGSVVFPDATAKFFLEASADERVGRRTRERSTDGADALLTRDQRDARVNPFVPAPGAVVIDTTGKSRDEVFGLAMAEIRGRLEADG
jgi:cytidylate kinase